MSLYAGTKHTFATDAAGRGAREGRKKRCKSSELVVEAAGIEPGARKRNSAKRKKATE